jgi:hypothetical protein
MTAGELIEILARWPADAPVMVRRATEGDSDLLDLDEVYRSTSGVMIIEA